MLTIAGGVVVWSLSWKEEDEGGEMSLVVVLVEPVGDNVGERRGRGSNDDDCGRGSRVIVIVVEGGEGGGRYAVGHRHHRQGQGGRGGMTPIA